MGCGLSFLRPLFDGDDPNIEYFTGRSNNCLTFNSKLYRSDRSVVCVVKLMKFAEKGTLLYENDEYKLEHRFESAAWELVDRNGTVQYSARKPSISSNILILDKFGDEKKSVQLKSIMRLKKGKRYDCEVFQVPTSLSDEQVEAIELKNDALISITNKNSFKEWEIEKRKSGEVCDKYLAFAFMMLLVSCKRKVRDEEEEERRKRFIG